MSQVCLDAAQFHDNSVFLLLVYFVRARDRLVEQGVPVQEIQDIMVKDLSAMSQRFPPGEGLKGDNEEVKKELEKL